MQFINQARSYVLDILRKCEYYPYHNPAHTLGVYERATYLALAENIEGEDFEDLQLACLFHDTGFTEQYNKNEFIGARIARRWLESHGHPEKRIEKIEGLIMATVLFSEPKTHLEKIIQDADLDNIGTKHEFYFSQRLLEEIRTIGRVDISDGAYWQFVYTLLTRYKFHTKTAKKERHEQQIRDIEHMEKFLSMIGVEIPSIESSTMHQV
ncbi:MAG: HD domain-containing protein [Candidatus Gracilibacteria bacterium]|nr:HD domain-containing protein [Candidatus Gracilibacteria bacterium]